MGLLPPNPPLAIHHGLRLTLWKLSQRAKNLLEATKGTTGFLAFSHEGNQVALGYLDPRSQGFSLSQILNEAYELNSSTKLP